jgi:hypothetical protein
VSATELGQGVHLVPAGEVFRDRYPSTLLAACGEPVTSRPEGVELAGARFAIRALLILADDAPTLNYGTA